MALARGTLYISHHSAASPGDAAVHGGHARNSEGVGWGGGEGGGLCTTFFSMFLHTTTIAAVYLAWLNIPDEAGYIRVLKIILRFLWSAHVCL